MENNKIKILFVDDESMICTMARDVMEFYGYGIDTFEDSRKALEQFIQNPDMYDLLITDQSMPDLPGYDLACNILNIRNSIPVILCTGYCKNVEELRENKIGISAFFVKPYNFDELIDQIEKLV